MNGRYGLKVFVLVERNASRPERETPGLRNFRSEPLKAPRFKPNGERKQVVNRHKQCLAQNHRHSLLRRSQRRLQPVRRVAAVMHRVPVFPFLNGLLGGAEALCQHRCRHGAGLDRRPNLRRCRRHCS